MVGLLLVALVVVLGVIVVARKKHKNNTEYFIHRAPIKALPIFIETWNHREEIFEHAEANIRLYGSVVPDVYDLGELEYVPLRRTSFGYKGKKNVRQNKENARTAS